MRTAKVGSRMAERAKARSTPGVVLPLVKAGMLKDFGLDTSRRWDIVHPSELSHQDRFCPRAVYLRITEGPVDSEKFDFVRENIFDFGNDRHRAWQDRLRKYTNLWGDWRCQICKVVCRASLEPSGYCLEDDSFGVVSHIWEYIEVSLDAEKEALICGHADGAFDDSLVEIKTVGEGTVRIEAPTLYARHTSDSGVDLKGLWKDIQRPFRTHLNQGDIYLWVCAQRGLPFTRISFVYESKWNQLVKEFVVEYDEKRSRVLVDQATSVQYAVKQKIEPGCKYPGECKECKPYDERREQIAAVAGRRRTVLVQGAEE